MRNSSCPPSGTSAACCEGAVEAVRDSTGCTSSVSWLLWRGDAYGVVLQPYVRTTVQKNEELYAKHCHRIGPDFPAPLQTNFAITTALSTESTVPQRQQHHHQQLSSRL